MSPVLIITQAFTEAANHEHVAGLIKGLVLKGSGEEYTDAHMTLIVELQNLLAAKSLLATFGLDQVSSFMDREETGLTTKLDYSSTLALERRKGRDAPRSYFC